jgi:large subunit ribosomal protein L43
MQEDGLPLLRLGRKLQGHEVRDPILFLVPPPRSLKADSTNPSSFIQKMLPKFAAAHPEIEITVSPRPSKHPVINAHYINGNTRTICVRNMHANMVQGKANLLRDSTGERNRRTKKPVQSFNESVRGIWSPYHGEGITV